MERNDVIKTIRENLKRRSGKPWSVTAGRGTAWGWLTIDAPPIRRTAHWVQKPGTVGNPEDYEYINTGEPNGHITPEDAEELQRLLHLANPIHYQGESIPADAAYWDEYVCRSAGVLYWD